MTKKAKLLAALAQKAPILLFAAARTLTVARVKAATYKTHKCTACSTQVAFGSQVGDGLAPFCPACGEATAPVDLTETVPMAPQEELLTAIGCPHCSNQNVIEDRTALAMAGTLHCASCGNGISFKPSATTADADADDAAEEMEDGDDVATDDGLDGVDDEEEVAKLEQAAVDARAKLVAKAVAKAVAKKTKVVADAPMSGADSEVNQSTAPDGAGPESGADSEDNQSTAPEGSGPMSGADSEVNQSTASTKVEAGDDESEDADTMTDVGDTDGDAGDGDGDEDDAAEPDMTGLEGLLDDSTDSTEELNDEEASIKTTAGDDDEDDFTELDMGDVADEDGDVDLQMVDPEDETEEAQLVAFVNGVHTMTLVKASAGDNADVFANTSFHKALRKEAKKAGFRALASYGFETVKIQVPLKRVVEKRVQAQLATDKAVLTASVEDVSANFDQCAKIAAVALTQNFYRDRVNPLQDQLVASLTAMGFKQAKQVVSQAMIAACPQFVEATLQLATELMGKSVELRNELSDNLSQMNPVVANMFDPLDDDVVDDQASEDIATNPEAVVARLRGERLKTTASFGAVETAGRNGPPSTAPVRHSRTSLGATLRSLKNQST
jgi:predicted RNA-binding Zn-ribbon protein involved in translation (DUF1610 family)